jgi:hypothetical protein
VTTLRYFSGGQFISQPALDVNLSHAPTTLREVCAQTPGNFFNLAVPTLATGRKFIIAYKREEQDWKVMLKTGIYVF